MMKFRYLMWICMFICIFLIVPTIVFAANAKIVEHATVPGCYGVPEHLKKCKVLEISGSGSAVYSIAENIEDGIIVEPNTEYTVSFIYKVDEGSFSFSVDNLPVESGDFNDPNWEEFSITFMTGDSITYPFKLRFNMGSATSKMYIDNLQMTPSPEPTKFNDFKYEVGCCPFDYCWTGGMITDHPSCIHDDFYEKNVSMPPIGWSLASFGGNPNNPSSFLNAPNGYRCINGSWEFARAKMTPLFDGAGYCLTDDQCFIGGYPDAARACVDSGEYRAYSGVSSEADQALEYFYCHEGNWTTRTKEIALQMLYMANRSTDNTYTIFCDKFDRSLNADETLSYYRDYVGDNIVSLLTSGVLNEFCVMELNGQIIAGVSLNDVEINETLSDVDDLCVKGGWACLTEGNCDPETGCLLIVPPDFIAPEKSFLEMLKGAEDTENYCDSAIQNKDGAYHPCDNQDIYYNSKLQSVIFAKTTETIQSVPFEETQSLISVIFEYLRDVIRDILGFAGVAGPSTELVMKEQLDFVRNAGSFDKLYISYYPEGPNGNPKSIKAIRETRARQRLDGIVDYRTFISAEYRNYQVDICRFFYSMYPDMRAQISNKATADNIQCTPFILNSEEWIHTIFVEEPVFELGEDNSDLWPVQIWKGVSDTFWNDITAKVRTQATRDMGGAAPAAPSFTTDPAVNPVVGTKITFSMEERDEDERLLARTWDFGDEQKASSAFNITTVHIYQETGDYPVKLWLMNDVFKISSAEQTVNIDIGPTLTWTMSQPPGTRDIVLDLVFTGGNTDYSVLIDWGDGTEYQEVPGIDTTREGIEHTYSSEAFGGLDAARFFVNVTGHDRDNVKFEKADAIVVNKPPVVPE